MDRTSAMRAVRTFSSISGIELGNREEGGGGGGECKDGEGAASLQI